MRPLLKFQRFRFSAFTSKGGLPACRKATRAASLHRKPSQNHPSTTQPDPTPPKTPGRCWWISSCRQPQRSPPSSAGASRQGQQAGWLVKLSGSVLTISQFLRGLILHLIVSQNVKMRGPTPDTPLLAPNPFEFTPDSFHDCRKLRGLILQSILSQEGQPHQVLVPGKGI